MSLSSSRSITKRGTRTEPDQRPLSHEVGGGGGAVGGDGGWASANSWNIWRLKLKKVLGERRALLPALLAADCCPSSGPRPFQHRLPIGTPRTPTPTSPHPVGTVFRSQLESARALSRPAVAAARSAAGRARDDVFMLGATAACEASPFSPAERPPSLGN